MGAQGYTLGTSWLHPKGALRVQTGTLGIQHVDEGS